MFAVQEAVPGVPEDGALVFRPVPGGRLAGEAEGGGLMPPKRPLAEGLDRDTTAALVESARRSLAVYLAIVHKTDMAEVEGGQAVPFAHHQRMIDVLTDGSLGHSLIVTPRGSGKTTLVQAWLEWELGRASGRGGNWAEETRLLYVGNTATQAYKVSNAIKNTIEFSDWYHAIFPKVRKFEGKWSETEWRVKGNEGQKDPTFQAMGITGPALGSRAGTIVLDDIADRENMATAYQREQIIYILTNVIKPILVPGGRIVMPGTRWAYDDPYRWATDQGWYTLSMKALEEGVSYWPERFPVEWLEREREADPRAFSRQYQNEVAPDEGLMFRREWFPRFDHLPDNQSALHKAVPIYETFPGWGRKILEKLKLLSCR